MQGLYSYRNAEVRIESLNIDRAIGLVDINWAAPSSFPFWAYFATTTFGCNKPLSLAYLDPLTNKDQCRNRVLTICINNEEHGMQSLLAFSRVHGNQLSRQG